MAIVILQLPIVKRKIEIRPRKCLYCPGETFQRWRKVRKPLRDSQFRSVQEYHYRGCLCHRSLRHYPEGVDRADQTKRLRKLAAICWVLGLSLRGVELDRQNNANFPTRQPCMLQDLVFLILTNKT